MKAASARQALLGGIEVVAEKKLLAAVATIGLFETSNHGSSGIGYPLWWCSGPPWPIGCGGIRQFDPHSWNTEWCPPHRTSTVAVSRRRSSP